MSRELIVLYGNDQGSNNVLDSVEKAANEQGLDVLRIPGLNVPVTNEHRARAAEASVIVLGISNSSGMPEVGFVKELLAENPALKGKIVFVEDFPGANGIRNEALRSIAEFCHLCAIMPSSYDAAERSVYKHVYTVGYPDHWLPSIDNIRFGIEARKSGAVIKRRIGVNGDSVTVGADEIVIYVSGFIDPEIETKALREILAIEQIRERPIITHFRAHPGEKNRLELKEAIATRDELLFGQWEIENEEIANAGRDYDARLIGVSDIIVAHPGATSTFFAGSLAKKMICVMEFVRPEVVHAQSYNYRSSGQRTHLIEKISELRYALWSLMRWDSHETQVLRVKLRSNTIRLDPKNPPSFGRNVVKVIRNLF